MLKPCPFCGSTDLDHDSTGAAEIRGVTYQTEWIDCNNCGVSMIDEVVEGVRTNNVVDKWNLRSL